MKEFICFNKNKHHKLFLKNSLDAIKDKLDYTVECKILLLPAGNSVLDLYTGKILPESIIDEVAQILLNLGINCKIEFTNWIKLSGKDYRNIILSDGSIWILRYIEKEKYVHLFPGRNSPKTFRCRASVLKTAAILYLSGQINLNIDDINSRRKEIFNLPPLSRIPSKQQCHLFD